MNTLAIQFGALVPQLHEQLPMFRRGALKQLQADADAVTRLKVRGFMTDAEARRIRHRLIVEIGKRVSGLEKHDV